ncbi:TPA: hypothetical protein NPO56_001370 [Klebsiella quasipneumoniae subsp. quasipneumoniae]|uniref:hypothetical protein n=1 Tax=Klebsiella quasipneumoniae TaxID=1463165 RepID=UPI000E2B3DA7|nr:hypothetical protein [Klebsiella quasipneumoniae]HCI5779674.1 hypothetical protein [Klebsiella quasipneumoniae subsp. quasipneumoniae]HCI6915951.1 hypothetical protein [Klebsiella quasipneumoniae subsp. similipneumoniae]SXD06239.1 Uncharacterised protein [Klebsiella quasipneumoniae]HCI6119060.1 hypothetical protein [Klebsiella quasipneumoniae subsp. quasipneumoniae]HCI6219617.1 hypothetical protein [Klebsiella quasipneumoniae subsp. quasipneumoniae]
MNSFDFLGFNRSEIEKTLGLNLHDSLLEYNIGLKKNLPTWLIPYISRDSLFLSDAAYLIMGINPKTTLRGEQSNNFNAFKESLWDAVDNSKLSAKDVVYYDNPEYGRRDCTLVRAELEKWVTEHEFNWPLPLQVIEQVKEQNSNQVYLDQWGEYPGKNTALMMISGMAIALEKSSKSFRNGEKLNKLAIARAVAQNLAAQGYRGMVVTEKQMTNLIKEALEITLPDSDE